MKNEIPVVDFTRKNGIIRRLNGGNLGPQMTRGNIDHGLAVTEFTELEIPITRLHDAPLPVEEKTARRLLNRLGERDARALIAVHRADTLALAPAWHDRLAELDALETLLDEQLAQDACFSLRQLAVNGRDVLAAGAAPGPAVGRTLDALLQRVLAGEIPNDRAVLLAELKNLIQ